MTERRPLMGRLFSFGLDGVEGVEPSTTGFKAQCQKPPHPMTLLLLDGEVGFEPTHGGTKNRWLTTCLLPKKPGPSRYWVRPVSAKVSTP